MVRSILITIGLLALVQPAFTSKIMNDKCGWEDVNGKRYVALSVIAAYGNGKLIISGDQITCSMPDDEFKVRVGSPNMFYKDTISMLSGNTTRIDGVTYVPFNLLKKIGWTCAVFNDRIEVCRPGANDQLTMMRLYSQVEPCKAYFAVAAQYPKVNPSPTKIPQVGIWYIAFFTGEDEFKHWKAVEDRKAAMPSCGRYSPADPKIIERQWREMRECGIDYILMDDTNTMWVDNGHIDKNIHAWFDFMDKKPANERIAISIAAGGELNQHSSKEGWTHAVDYMYKEFSQRPSYLRNKDKPVLHWYIERDVWPEWTDDRWTIRHTYHFFRTGDQITHGGWGYGADLATDRCIKECMSFHPGWDLSPPGHLREGGETYKRLWMNALRCKPDSVLLACWNGWNEGDAIEDSDAWKDVYGDPAPSWYRLLTRGYISAYKGQLVDGFYYLSEDAPEVFQWKDGILYWQGSYPHKIPVIVLPKGMLRTLASGGQCTDGSGMKASVFDEH